MRIFLAVLLLFCSSTIYAADNFPPEFTARYKLYARGFQIGEGTRTLKSLPDGRKVFESYSRTTGILAVFRDDQLEERTIFRLNNGKAHPLEYIYNHTGSKKQKQVHLIFDWDKKLTRNVVSSDPWEITITDNTLDKLLYQVVLMQELQQGKRQLEYVVPDKDKIKVYVPKFLGKERINTDSGEFDVLKYQHVSQNGNRRTTLWCAPALHFLPIRVEHVEKKDGDVVTLMLQSVEGLSKKS